MGMSFNSGGGGSPGGSDTEFQYNNSDSFEGLSGFVTDGTDLTINDDIYLQFGDGADFKIRYNSTGGRFQISDTAGNVFFSITDNGSVGTTNVNAIDVNSSGLTTKLGIKGGGATDSTYAIITEDSSDSETFSVSDGGTVKINDEYTLPTADGSANQVMQTDGSGAVTFETVSAGATTLDGLTDVTTTSDNSIWIMNAGQGSAPVTGTGGGVDNFACLDNALNSVTSGTDNICIGADAGTAITSATGNIAIGKDALKAEDIRIGNVAIGVEALSVNNSLHGYNVAVGYGAGNSLVNYGHGVYIGAYTGDQDTGGQNTFIGYQAGNGMAGAGQLNSCLGYQSDCAVANNQIAVGYSAVATGANEGIWGNASIATNNITVDWTVTSDKRIKSNIKNNDIGLKFINALRPVTFTKKHPATWDSKIREKRYKKGGNDYDDKKRKAIKDEFDSSKKYIGLIAQEVKEVVDTQNVEFSGWSEDKNGKQGIQYSALVVPLINAIKELTNKIDNLEKKLNDPIT